MAIGSGSAGQYDGAEVHITGGKQSIAATMERPDYAKTSDDDILGIEPDAPELGDLGADQPKDAASTKQGDEPQKVRLGDENEILELDDDDKDEKPKSDSRAEEEEKAKPEKPAEPLTPLKVSEELKAHFADPQVGKELKTAFYQAAAYKEIFPDFQQAKEIAELFPSAEEARHVSESYEGFRELQEAYESNPTRFVEQLHAEGSEEFAAIADAVVSRLPDLNPAAYHRVGMRVLADSLAYCIEDTAAIVAKSGLSPDNLIAAANVIAMNLFGGKDVRELMNPSTDPQQERISKLETELRTERASRGSEQHSAFMDDVLSHADTGIDKSVDELLTQLLEVEGAVVSKAARQKIGEEIKAEVTAGIRSQKRIGEAVVDLVKAKDGDFSQAHLKRAADPIIKAANLLIRKAAGTIVPKYTREILQTHANRMDRQARAAERRDVGSGGGPRVGSNGGAPKVVPDMIDYSRTSDDDILSDEPRVTLKRGAAR